MFNKVLIVRENVQRIPCYLVMDSIIEGEVVSFTPHRRLVDERLKFSSVSAVELAKNGHSPSQTPTIAPTIEDAHMALNLVRKISDDAAYKEMLESRLAELSAAPSVPEPTTEPNVESKITE